MSVSESCASTFDGDADEQKLAGLSDIDCIHLILDESDHDSIDVHICDPCLNKQVQESWIEAK